MNYSTQLVKYTKTRINLVASLLHQINVLKKMKQGFKEELLEIRNQMNELKISQKVGTRLDFTMLGEEGDCLTDEYVKKCVCLESNVDKVVVLREKKTQLIEKFLDSFENGKQTIRTISLEITFMNDAIDRLKKDEAYDFIEENLKKGCKYIILEGENEFDVDFASVLFNVEDVYVCLKQEGVEVVKGSKSSAKETVWFTRTENTEVYDLDKSKLIGKMGNFYRLHNGIEVRDAVDDQTITNLKYKAEICGYQMLSSEMWKKAKLVQRV